MSSFLIPFYRGSMGKSKVEKVAYFFGWFLLGPINVSLGHLKNRLKKRNSSGAAPGQRLLVANSVGLISLILKLDGEITSEKITRAASLVLKAYKLSSDSLSSLESLFKQFLGSSLDFHGLVNTLPQLIGKDQKKRNLVFKLLVYISNSVSGSGWDTKLLFMRVADCLKVPLSGRVVLINDRPGNIETGTGTGLTENTFYLRFLELDPCCDTQQIHRQYRKIVKTVHPDLYPKASEDVRQARITAMQELNRIYKYLVIDTVRGLNNRV